MAMGTPLVWPSTANTAPSPWLWTRVWDTVWVTGGGFFVFAAIAVPLTFAWAGFGAALVVAFTHIAGAVNYPHYAATYQLVYRERAKSPRNFRMMLLSLPVLLLAAVLGVAFPNPLDDILLRVYLTWSAYHYAAQHFGIAAMYSAKSGRPLDTREKRALQVAFVGVGFYMMVVLNLFTYDPRAGGDGEVLLHALLPRWTFVLAVAGVVVSLVATFLTNHWIKARTGRGHERTVWWLLATNFAWFVLPYVWYPGLPGPWMGPALGIWIPVALPFFHCAQYLAVSGHRSRSTGAVRPVFLLIALMGLGFFLFEGTAAVIYGTHLLSEQRALLLMASLVNIHHFWMDGIVWKRPKKAPAKVAPSGGLAAA